MKKVLVVFLVLVVAVGFTSCERVAPNYYGVLMENYGKSGKDDYSKQQGRVSTMSPGTELFQVPAWEQRGKFTNDEGEDRVLQVKAADNTAFTSKPLYSYKVIESRVVDVVFQNSRLGSGDDFMTALQDNVLEPRIYDIIKEASRSYTTEQLMANGGSLKFEQYVQNIVTKEFEKSGLQLVSFSLNLDFSSKVKAKIDSRNEVNTNISVLDQQIAEQRKRNELEILRTEQNKIRSAGITPQILQEQAIRKWNGKLPTTYAGGGLPFVKAVN
jgi:regulator of protease activity HflC (stomatin/prohibitin superfamily)